MAAQCRYKYPVCYLQSMNTVLTQELVRYNGLLTVLHETLADARRALSGAISMSSELDSVCSSMCVPLLPLPTLWPFWIPWMKV